MLLILDMITVQNLILRMDIFSLLKVYESNSDRTEMASSIRGPCEVLPSDKFKQENDRRCQLRNEESSRVQPIFLCRFVSLNTSIILESFYFILF